MIWRMLDLILLNPTNVPFLSLDIHHQNKWQLHSYWTPIGDWTADQDLSTKCFSLHLPGCPIALTMGSNTCLFVMAASAGGGRWVWADSDCIERGLRCGAKSFVEKVGSKKGFDGDECRRIPQLFQEAVLIQRSSKNRIV